jgi:hypothetical protein
MSNQFSWWLQPVGRNREAINIAGAGLLVAIYALMMLAFWRFW